MGTSKLWVADDIFRLLINTLKPFGFFSFKINPDGSPRKTLLLYTALSAVVAVGLTYEIVNLFEGFKDILSGSTAIMSIVLRYISLTLHTVFTVTNAVLFSPPHLMKYYKHVRLLDKAFPLRLSTFRCVTYGVFIVSIIAIECTLHLIFRHPNGFSEGSLLQNGMAMIIALYLRIISVTFDVLFIIFGKFTQYYYKRIIMSLKETTNQRRSKLFFVCPFPKELTFKVLRDLFGILSDAKMELQSAFSMHFFVSTFMVFVEGIAWVFLIVDNNYLQSLPTVHLNLSRVHISLTIGKTLIMIYISQKLTSHVDDIGIEVHRLYNATSDERNKTEIMAFSMEIIHRKRPLTALNMFNMDFTLLPSMIGSMGTHVVVFLQSRNFK